MFFHGAGKARIAETRMMTASTPLQPRSIEIANPFVALDRDDKAATGILDQLAVRDRAAIKQMDDPRTDIRQHRGERHDHMALNRPRQFGDKQDHKQDEKQHDEAKHGGSDVSAKDAV